MWTVSCPASERSPPLLPPPPSLSPPPLSLSLSRVCVYETLVVVHVRVYHNYNKIAGFPNTNTCMQMYLNVVQMVNLIFTIDVLA